MNFWVIFCIGFAIAALDSHSFISPLIPDHAHKFDVIGSALPLKKYVRLTPPTADKNGAIISKAPLEDSLVVIEVGMYISGANVDEDIGSTIWFSQNAPEQFALGPIYGVTDEFKGFGVVINPAKQEIRGYMHMLESVPLSIDIVHNSASCKAVMRGEFHVEIESMPNSIIVNTWQKGKEKTKCLEFETSVILSPFIGMSAVTGSKALKIFDIAMINTEIPMKEGNKYESLKMMQDSFKTEIAVVKSEVIELTDRIKQISESQELIDIQNKIGDLKLLAKNLKDRGEKVKESLMVLHVDDTFAVKSNEYIRTVGAQALKLLDKVKKLQDYVSNQGLLRTIENSVDNQSKKTTGTGKQLEEAAARSHEKTKLINEKLQNDYRFTWIFSGLGGLVLVVGLSMVKLWNVEKIHTL